MKFYTEQEMLDIAKEQGIKPKVLKEVVELQSKAIGTFVSNHAKTVFHRDIFKQLLSDAGLTGVADDLAKHWDEPTQVNLEVAETLWNKPTVNEVKQEQHFDNVLQLILTLRPELSEATRKQLTECGYKACTIGLGQILGKEFKQCGYTDFNKFIEDMYDSEANQLKALATYMKTKGTTSDAQAASTAINKAVKGLPLIAGSKDTDVGYQADLLRATNK